MLTRSYIPPESSKNLLAYTPMIHARLFKEGSKFRNHNFQPVRSSLESIPDPTTLSSSDIYLDGNPLIDRPLFVQFCANDPDELLEAAKYVQPFCDAVDLNLGCPQGIARKGHYGAFLQDDWDLIFRIVNNLHENLDVPITAKIRIQETREKTLAYAKVILSAGASVLTVHGRQRDQKGHNTGLADWSVLRYLRENLPSDTVIFANGNILQHEDIQRCLEETGADGVMSAEGNLCDPTIFSRPPEIGREGRNYWRGRDRKGGHRIDSVFRRYMDIIYQHVLEEPAPVRAPLYSPSDPVNLNVVRDVPATESIDTDQPPTKKQKREKYIKPTSPNILAMRAHLFRLLRPLLSIHTNIRDSLARCRAGDISAFENVLRMTEQAVKQGLIDYESDPSRHETSNILGNGLEEQQGKDESSIATVDACKRPWWVCQPYVRPLPQEAIEKGSMKLGKKAAKRLEEEEALKDRTSQGKGPTEREILEETMGMPGAEMPKENMVCG